MVMRRLFGRKKKDDETDEATDAELTEESMTETEVETVPEPVAESTETPTVPTETTSEIEMESQTEDTVPPVERIRRAETIPYHDSLPKRLKYLLEESPISSTIEGPDEFSIELMASGERTWIKKASNGPIQYGTGAIPDEDVFIRVSDDVVSELLDAPTFEEFSRIYMNYYRNAGPGKYVKIELRKSITDLNRRGYARVPLLKLLVGAAR